MTTLELAPTGTNQHGDLPLLEAEIAALRGSVRGTVLAPGEPGYDEARSVYNAMNDRRPRLIVRCRDVADVIAAVDFAREQELPLSVRGGGHSVPGFGTNDGGMVVDLSEMRSVRVDPKAKRMQVDGGSTWGDVDHASHAFGLATPSGIISTTGVGGLTLGGGFGYLSRKHGLACDNLISADVVTADGRFVRASADEHPDLFWALRGGGGNFGVVTSFEYRLHPVDTVYGGPIFYPIERAGEVMRFYRDFIAQAPEELGAFFGFHIGPPAPFIPAHLQGVPMCAIVACYSGDLEGAAAAVQPLRDVTPAALDLMGPLPYPALNSLFDGLLPAGLQHYWKADFDRELSDGAIAVHETYGPRVPNFLSLMHLYPLDGAVQRIAATETAYSYREARFAHIIAGIDADPAQMPAHTAWVREYWGALHPFSAGGAYVNFLMDEGQDRVRATYRDNYPRLVGVKDAYDPGNLFRQNQNIRPSTSAAR